MPVLVLACVGGTMTLVGCGGEGPTEATNQSSSQQAQDVNRNLQQSGAAQPGTTAPPTTR